jgi:hypothetical protein
MNAHEGKRDQGSAAQVFSNEGVDSSAVLESIKQRRQAFRLIVQRKHRFVHQREGTSAHFGHDPSLGNPILEYR